MHCSGLQRDSLGDPLFAMRGQWRRRAGDSDETPPIDLLLLYCVRGPAVFSRFLVCQSHKLEDFVSQASKAPPPQDVKLPCVRACVCVCLFSGDVRGVRGRSKQAGQADQRPFRSSGQAGQRRPELDVCSLGE